MLLAELHARTSRVRGRSPIANPREFGNQVTVHRPPAVRPHRRHTNEFCVVCVYNKFCFSAKTNGHPRFVK